MATPQCPVCGRTDMCEGCRDEFEGWCSQLYEVVDGQGKRTGVYDFRYTAAQAKELAYIGHARRETTALKAKVEQQRANVAAGLTADGSGPLVGTAAQVNAAKAAARAAIDAGNRDLDAMLQGTLAAVRGA